MRLVFHAYAQWLAHKIRSISAFAACAAAACAASPDEPAEAVSPSDVAHGVAYARDGVEEGFAGWPANEGMWAWGDEILVAFQLGDYSPSEKRHSIALKGTRRIGFARSLDGGKTWATEYHDEIAGPDAEGDPKTFPANKTVHGGASDCPKAYDFTADGFCMKPRGDVFYVSENRGHTWDGPYRFKGLEDAAPFLAVRSTYFAAGKHEALVFLTARERGKEWRSAIARTEDGGRTFSLLSWIDSPENAAAPHNRRETFSIMPAFCQMPDGRLVVVLREKEGKRTWLDALSSADGGRTWSPRVSFGEGCSNPPALVLLADGETIACIYGHRRNPFGIRASLSADGGKTWTPPFALREDGRNWDFGYPRACLLPDGRVFAAYYYTTAERPQHHIATTLWALSPEVLAVARAARERSQKSAPRQ